METRIMSFNGVFKSSHRRKLRSFREKNGLSFRQMGRIFGCDWTTVAKWERGDSKECSLMMLVTLQAFFQGKMDHVVIRISEECYIGVVNSLKQLIQLRQQETMAALNRSREHV